MDPIPSAKCCILNLAIFWPEVYPSQSPSAIFPLPLFLVSGSPFLFLYICSFVLFFGFSILVKTYGIWLSLCDLLH